MFPASWLDDWHDEGDGSYGHWSKGVVALRKLAQVALQTCHSVWTTAAAEWRRNDENHALHVALSRAAEHVIEGWHRWWGPRPAIGVGRWGKPGQPIYLKALSEAKLALSKRAAVMGGRKRKPSRMEALIAQWKSWPEQEMIKWWGSQLGGKQIAAHRKALAMDARNRRPLLRQMTLDGKFKRSPVLSRCSRLETSSSNTECQSRSVCGSSQNQQNVQSGGCAQPSSSTSNKRTRNDAWPPSSPSGGVFAESRMRKSCKRKKRRVASKEGDCGGIT